MIDYAIQVRNLEMRFSNDFSAVRNLSFVVPAGQAYCIVGPNGAGKTTLLRMILGLLRPSAGEIMICGHDIRHNRAAICALTAYLPEQVSLYAEMNALENLEYFLRLSGQRQLRRDEYSAFLSAVGLPRTAEKKELKYLSKGMRQKVGLAIAIGKGARILILDEPMSGLDPQSTRELIQILRTQCGDGKAVLMVSHDLASVTEVADKIGLMGSGSIEVEIERERLGENPLLQLYSLYDHLTTISKARAAA